MARVPTSRASITSVSCVVHTTTSETVPAPLHWARMERALICVAIARGHFVQCPSRGGTHEHAGGWNYMAYAQSIPWPLLIYLLTFYSAARSRSAVTTSADSVGMEVMGGTRRITSGGTCDWGVNQGDRLGEIPINVPGPGLLPGL